MDTMFAQSSNTYVKVVNNAAYVNTLNNIDNIVGINIVKRTIFKFMIRKINAYATSANTQNTSKGCDIFNILKLTIK